MQSDKIRLFTIPNAITCLNLLSGCVAIVFALSGNLNIAFICVLLSAVFDFFDGFAARLLKSYSAVGVQLDSLADVVSFGVAPAAMMCLAMQQKLSVGVYLTSLSAPMLLLIFSPFLLAVFSALRLAKFNVDDRQTTSFLGLPTPANALFFASLSVVCNDFQISPYALLLAVLLFCFLLVSEIPMFSLKIKDFSVKTHAFQLAFVALSLVVLLYMVGTGKAIAAFVVIILMYITLSVIKCLLKW